MLSLRRRKRHSLKPARARHPSRRGMEVEQGVDVVPDGGHARAHAADQVEAPAERVVDRREAGGRALVPGDLLERGAEHAHVAAGLVARCCQGDASMVSCGRRNVKR